MPSVDTIAQLTAFEGRGPGSEVEGRVALWLGDELGGGGRSVRVEPFSCHPNWALAQAWHALLGLAGGLVAVYHPTVGAAMVLAALIFVVTDAATGVSPGRVLTPSRTSHNVVAVRADPAGAKRVRLILTANYDAGRMGLVYRDGPRRLAARLRRATGGRAPGWVAWFAVILLWLLVVAVARMRGSHGTTIGVLELPPTIALVLAFALFLELATSPVGPAASDNASGAAAAIALARALDVGAPRALSVELVLAGAGEGGAAGLRHFLRARRRELTAKNTIVLGIAACGGGSPRWWHSDGALLPLAYHPRLRELCAGVARSEPQLDAAPHRGRGASPAFPARAAGLPALAIGCLDELGLVPRSHQPTDAASAIERAGVDKTVELGLMLVDAIDAELAAGGPPRASGATPA